MDWSHYSQTLFDEYTNTNDNLIVYACPGAGKTTNIKHLWTLDDEPTVYLVFEKHNQVEADAKLPKKQGSAVLTLNGLGHRAVLSAVGRVILDNNKVYKIIKDYIKIPEQNYKVKQERIYALAKATQMAKQVVPGLFSKDTYEDMLSVYDLDDYEGMYYDVERVLSISDDMLSTIDFADQLRLPVVHGLKMPQYANVLGDEAQDFSTIQGLLVQMIHADRYAFVGDMHQSIYGFRGAMSDSMQVLQSMFR